MIDKTTKVSRWKIKVILDSDDCPCWDGDMMQKCMHSDNFELSCNYKRCPMRVD